TNRSEPVDWINDARATPDVFSPLCDFTATLVLKQSASVLAVGWYNVDPAGTSPPSEIHEIVPAGSPVGTMITGANIRSDPRYLGGLIGFALIRTPPHYTESRWNTVCSAGACAGTPGPWILSLSYASGVTENAWYVAFEDGDTSASSWNNDGDYNDYVFFFTGITCAGSGQPCTVSGAQGVCANGLSECATGGTLTCRQVSSPSAERCDGADNDCNGTVDDGDGLCGASQVCVAGVCVDRCFEGGCPEGESCSGAGVCLEDACATVMCNEGQRCVGGTCIGACDGIVCPGDQICRVGACIDPCLGITCDGGRVCEGGVCVEGCACRGCPGSRECAPSGQCVAPGCSNVTCDLGLVCRAGACVDACMGAVCPSGQICRTGECVPEPITDGGVAMVDGGGGAGSDGAIGNMDGGGGDAGGDPTLGGGCSCGCRTAPGIPTGWSLVGLLVLVFSTHRRRSRRP
ncbi:MAG: hypothetical protein K8H88_26680, partial [Sandaracinaceae bacterium]|nr:hypothetical protein [Sandaracinaceae bacterium]